MAESFHGWRDRFDRLVDRKTRRAESAVLSPYTTDLADPPAGALALDNDWSARLFDGPFYVSPARDAGRPACSLVFVQSRDGNTAAPNPQIFGGGDTDQHLIYEGLSRVAADAVLAGSGSVGADQLFSVWHPELVALRASRGLPRHPVQIVATLQGVPLDRLLIFNVPQVRAVLLTLSGTAARLQAALDARPWVSAIVMRTPGELPQALSALAAMGIGCISCVGGHTLARRLLADGLVDDVYLTTGVRAGGEPDTPLSHERWRDRVVLKKRGTGAEAGVVFEHVRPLSRVPAP